MMGSVICHFTALLIYIPMRMGSSPMVKRKRWQRSFTIEAETTETLKRISQMIGVSESKLIDLAVNEPERFKDLRELTLRWGFEKAEKI